MEQLTTSPRVIALVTGAMARMSAVKMTSSPVAASKPCPITIDERGVDRSSMTLSVLIVIMRASGGLGDVGLARQS